MEEQCNNNQDQVVSESEQSQKKSDDSLTKTVLDPKDNFDSDQSLCDQSRKLTSESQISKKEPDNKSMTSVPPQNLDSPTPRRLNKLRDHTSTVFPAGCMGCPEDPPSEQLLSPRRFLDAMEAKEHAPGLIDNTPKKRPSSAKPVPFFRNPVTGVGVDVEEVKKTTKKRGGNPLLGEGYDCDIKQGPNPSNSRIPPGGYSKGLW